MYTSVFNEGTATLVCRYSLPVASGDYTDYLADLPRFVAAARSLRRHAVLVVDIDDGYPQPNAVQRRSIGEEWARANDVQASIAILSSSVLMRGIITAIQWFSKQSQSQQDTRPFASPTEAVIWLEKRLGTKLPAVPVAIEQLRAGRRVGRYEHP